MLQSWGSSLYQAKLFVEHPLRPRLERDKASRGLAAAALGQLLRQSEPTQSLLGTGTIHLTQFRLRPGLRFKLSELARQMNCALH